MLRINGRQHRRTIGRYPNWSLADAREEARRLIREADLGIDPRAAAAAQMDAALTFVELVDDYTAKHLKPNARSWLNISRCLKHPCLGHLRTRQAASITKREFVQVLDRLMAANKPQAAVNLLRYLKMLFNWAVERDLVPGSPCAGIRPPAKTVERDRVLTDAEIIAVWQATFQLPPPYGQMFRLFFLTGQRRSEVVSMRWCDITGDLWTIPREVVKKDRAHTVPLTATAMATVRSLPFFRPDGYVITTSGGKRPSSNFDKMKKELDRLSGVTGWVIHDIRRTVRSKLAELGISREIARKVVNHEDGKVDRIYNRHEYQAEKREALEKWEKHLLSHVDGSLLAKANEFVFQPS